MGRKPEDLTGLKFGKLTAVRIIEKARTNGTKWLCRCDCGNETTAWAGKLKSGKKKSCGCLWRRSGRYADGNGPEPKLAGVWKQLKQRCGNPNNKDYQYYGARGVTVCEEWQSFRGFEAWALNNGYKEGLTIDRIDGTGNYTPDNCQWISAVENCKKQTRRAPHDQQTSLILALPALQTPALQGSGPDNRMGNVTAFQQPVLSRAKGVAVMPIMISASRLSRLAKFERVLEQTGLTDDEAIEIIKQQVDGGAPLPMDLWGGDVHTAAGLLEEY